MSAECPAVLLPQNCLPAAPQDGLPGLAPVLPLVPRASGPPGPQPGQQPLSGVAAVRILRLPDASPPYDDEAVDGRGWAPYAGGPRVWPGPASGPGDARLPCIEPAPNAGPVLAAVPDLGEPPGAVGSEPDPDGPPSGWPRHFAQVLAETLSGARPPRQITPWTTGQARRHIERLGPTLALGATPQVRRLVTFRPCADVIEMTVVLGVGPRTRALAVRLERDRLRAAEPGEAARPRPRRWRCTAVEAA